jgi:hypothetical protein
MTLRYETGTATFIHFIVMMILGFVGLVASVVEQCHNGDFADCAQGSVISFVYLFLLAGWFGFLSVLGYAAQDQRSHRLARFLMVAEFMVLGVALFQAKHYPDILALLTSLTDAAFAAWIIVLAWRLSKAKGGRISASNRPRRRPVRRAS